MLEAVKLYTSYQAQAEHMNCPVAHMRAQKIVCVVERAELLNDIKQVYREKCREKLK
jgi:hypothetical protein